MTKIVSLFGGIGGFDKGFKDAGFEIGLANDPNHTIAELYRMNFPGVFVHENNLDNVCTCGYAHRHPTGVIARLPKETQEEALIHTMRILEATKPVFFVAVADGGIEPEEDNKDFKHISNSLANKGYDVYVQTMKALDYCPSCDETKYLVLVGFKEGVGINDFNFPQPTVTGDSERPSYTSDSASKTIAYNKGLFDDFYLGENPDDEVIKQALIDTPPAGLGKALAMAIKDIEVTVTVPIAKLN